MLSHFILQKKVLGNCSHPSKLIYLFVMNFNSGVACCLQTVNYAIYKKRGVWPRFSHLDSAGTFKPPLLKTNRPIPRIAHILVPGKKCVTQILY